MRRALFCVLFASYAYFYQGGGWGQNSRYDLVRAMTLDRSFRIDAYHKNTGDKAYENGHYYSDKAPGQAFLALLVVDPLRSAVVAAGGDPETFEGIAFLSYMATVFTVGLTTALAGVVLFDLALAWGASFGGALFAATAFGLATPIWPLATVFIAHALAASCLVLAFAGAWAIGQASRGSPLQPQWASCSLIGWLTRRKIAAGLIVGASAGWATVSEFPAAAPATIIAAWTALQAVRQARQQALRIITAMTSSALLCALVLLTYQYLCFGSPFHVSYSSEQGFEGMQQGLFGITWPRPGTVREILFGEFRGLLPLAPLVPVGALGLLALRGTSSGVVVAAVITLFYVGLNSSYHYWEGGWSFGPRHLAPALPFLCLGLAPLWSRARWLGRGVLLTLCLWGAGLAFMGVAVMAQPPASYKRPVRELLWPAFRDGDLALSTQTFLHHGTDPGRWRLHEEPRAAWNLGMKLGLSGHASLLPLVLLWFLCGAWMRAALNRLRSRVAPLES